MSLAREVAWRYLRRPTDRLISAVGAVSVLGLVIGVMALVISMALMTGYRRDLEQKLLAGNAELFVYSIGGALGPIEPLLNLIRSVEGVQEASPVVFQQALVTSEQHANGEQVMLKGVTPRAGESSPMLRKILGGRQSFNAPKGVPGVAIGHYLARKLRAEAGSSLTVTVPSESSGSFFPQSATYVVTKVYDTGFFEFDARWLFIDLREAESLLQKNPAANLIEVKLKPGADLDHVVSDVDRVTGRRYAVTDWRDMNRPLFSLLRMQQMVLFIVIGLIVFVSTFNIVSTLIMTAHEKRKEIGTLVAMGGEPRLIRRIFMWYGTFVGLAGTLTGLVLGVVVCWVITRYRLVSFGPEIAEVYFVSSIPFITRARDLLAIGAFSTVISYLATIVPSARAARLDPIQALRTE
jgi:lipoprotein-releasing system permease protein